MREILVVGLTLAGLNQLHMPAIRLLKPEVHWTKEKLYA